MRFFPTRLGSAPAEAGASPSPPCRQGRVRPNRGWSRTRASASVRVAGSLRHRSWRRGCPPLPAPPDRGPSPGWISDRRLGSRPACRAGSGSGHDELLVWSGSGSAGCPSRPVTEGHLPPARGSDSICRQEAASDGGPPTSSPSSSPLPFFGRRSSGGAPATPYPPRPWMQFAGSHHGAKCNSSVFPQTTEPKTRGGGTGEKKHLETWVVAAPWGFPHVCAKAAAGTWLCRLTEHSCVPLALSRCWELWKQAPGKVETASNIPLKIKKEKALLASLKMSLLRGYVMSQLSRWKRNDVLWQAGFQAGVPGNLGLGLHMVTDITDRCGQSIKPTREGLSPL